MEMDVFSGGLLLKKKFKKEKNNNDFLLSNIDNEKIKTVLDIENELNDYFKNEELNKKL